MHLTVSRTSDSCNLEMNTITSNSTENIPVESNETWTDSYPEFSLPASVRSWLILIIEIPSLVCSIILLYYLIFNQAIRKSMNNHVIIALLIIGLFSQLIDNPFYLNYLRLGYVWPQIPFSCFIWWFAATGISNMTNLVMAWASIERHILVFHNGWLSTKKKRFFVHYLPLLIILLYGFIYYIIILSIYSCENIYAYTTDWCFYPCYYNDEKLAIYDTIMNSIIPTPIIIISSIALIIRVVKRKRALHQCVHWRKYRKMIIQLLSISALFLLFNLPMTTLLLAHICGLPDGAAGQFEFYTYYMYRFISLFLPFICLITASEIRKKIKEKILPRRRINTVGTK